MPPAKHACPRCGAGGPTAGGALSPGAMERLGGRDQGTGVPAGGGRARVGRAGGGGNAGGQNTLIRLQRGHLQFPRATVLPLQRLSLAAVRPWDGAARPCPDRAGDGMGAGCPAYVVMHTFFAVGVRVALLALGIRSPWLHVPAAIAAGVAGPLGALRLLEWMRLDSLEAPRRWPRREFCPWFFAEKGFRLAALHYSC